MHLIWVNINTNLIQSKSIYKSSKFNQFTPEKQESIIFTIICRQMCSVNDCPHLSQDIEEYISNIRQKTQLFIDLAEKIEAAVPGILESLERSAENIAVVLTAEVKKIVQKLLQEFLEEQTIETFLDQAIEFGKKLLSSFMNENDAFHEF